MIHFLLKSVLPTREQVNGTARLLLPPVIELDNRSRSQALHKEYGIQRREASA